MGNHRDAWVKGATDPGSGSAVMMELTRTLGEIHKNGNSDLWPIPVGCYHLALK